MKTTTAFLTALLASASCVTAASVPNQARHIADGLYQVSVDDAGNKNTKFTPIDQVSESPTPRSESPLEKRREGCGPGSGDANAANDAVSCLKNSFLTDPVYFNANAWTYVRIPFPSSFLRPTVERDIRSCASRLVECCCLSTVSGRRQTED